MLYIAVWHQSIPFCQAEAILTMNDLVLSIGSGKDANLFSPLYAHFC